MLKWIASKLGYTRTENVEQMLKLYLELLNMHVKTMQKNNELRNEVIRLSTPPKRGDVLYRAGRVAGIVAQNHEEQ